MLETSAVGVIFALQEDSRHLRDHTPVDDVINMAMPPWAQPDPRRLIVGGRDRMLCSLTVTVRRPYDELRDENDDSFSHFIFRNRMSISQPC